MCWVALNRAITLADLLHAQDRVHGWAAVRDQIHRTVVEDGWSDDVKAFTQYLGSDELDASALMMTIVGFLPPVDPRMHAAIDAIDERLTDARGMVYRYRTEHGIDGLTGDEGTFLLCTFWLAQALALAGQVARARTVFERAVQHLNDVDLLAEEIDPETGDMVGNFPQAFSHVGLINAAGPSARPNGEHRLRLNDFCPSDRPRQARRHRGGPAATGQLTGCPCWVSDCTPDSRRHGRPRGRSGRISQSTRDLVLCPAE
jgi:GH15 family glucan-1,4-alpha-glucosidase